MKKMEYRRPAADLIFFENEDIIMTSDKKDDDTGCWYNPGYYSNYEGCQLTVGYTDHLCYEATAGYGEPITGGLQYGKEKTESYGMVLDSYEDDIF